MASVDAIAVNLDVLKDSSASSAGDANVGADAGREKGLAGLDAESAISLYEPRPGEHTYAAGTSNKDVGRPTLEGLRNPGAKEAKKLAGMFEETKDDEDANLTADDEKKKPAQAPVKFGMWDGVFARCLLNIFGVIMFLRVPWLVAYAGVWMSIVVVLVSVFITTITSLSLSAICTNGEIKGGGAYYLISRSLGPQFGGAIGIMFYFANTVAVAMYLIGFAETIVNMTDAPYLIAEGWDLRIIAIISLIVIQIICLVGVEYVVKVQLGLLALLVCSLLVFLIGAFIPNDLQSFSLPFGSMSSVNAVPDYLHESVSNVGNATTGIEIKCPLPTTNKGMYTYAETLDILDKKVGFGSALAVFFPAVTGIMAGANISGDLKDASSAIPTGTNAAIAVSTIVYILLIFWVGAVAIRATPGVMIGDTCPFGGIYLDYIFMARIAAWPPLVYAGIFASTISSGIASLVGAPRILQAVAKDQLFPKTLFLARGCGPNEEPIAAYMLTFVLSVGCILIGDLNAIAPLITNFFMCTYALTNLACFMADVSRSPGWRPTFKWFNRWMSLFGAVLCTGFMLFLNLIMGFASLVVGVILYFIVGVFAPEHNWGSASEGYRYITAKREMTKLNATLDHVKNYRPQLLLLMEYVHDQEATGNNIKSMFQLACDLKKAHGVIVAGTIILPPEEIGLQRKLSNKVDYELMEDALAALVSASSENTENPYQYDKAIRRAICDTANAQHAKQSKKQKKTKVDVLFAEVVHAETLLAGARCLMQSAGLGAMRPNTLVMGFMENWKNAPASKVNQYVSIIGSAFDNGMGVILLRSANDSYESAATVDRSGDERARAESEVKDEASVVDANADQQANTMDCWWFSDDGGFTMLLPHLILKSKQWRSQGTPMRLMNPLREDQMGQAGKEVQRLETLVTKFRIGASVSNILLSNLQSPTDGTYEELEQTVTKKGSLGSLSASEVKMAKARLRMGEIIRARSRKARTCVVSFPVPRRDKEGSELQSRIFLAGLDALTVISQTIPVLMVHGNQSDALTFYS